MSDNVNQNNTPEEEININEYRQIRLEKLESLQSAGKDPFQVTVADQDTHSGDIRNDFENYEGKTVSVCGRIMTKRVMGKASFIDLQDRKGRIQSYVRRDDVGEDVYADFKKWDIGDIIEVKGYVFKTMKGEISVHASSVKLLTKSLLPLPEKYHGLTNTDTRYRRRYLDLIVNPEVKDIFEKRSQIIKEIRNYLDAEDFIEVETPMLVTNAGGAAARPFLTHHNALDLDMKLRISLELYLKRLIVGGMERVYEIGRVFRNEGCDIKHNPEFTLMELYQAYTDYHGMMDLVENLIRTVAKKVLGNTVVTYGETVIDLEKPFRRLTMVDAVKEYANIDYDSMSFDEIKAFAEKQGIEVEPRHKKGDILNLIFEEFVEDKLDQPTFITDHPVEISPLTKRKPDKPEFTERFELYITCREFANAYSELNDPIDQRARFALQDELYKQGDEEAEGNHTDEDFLDALEYGMPPTGGIGVGIDRLVMFLTNAQSIRDVLLFPTMKPIE